MSESDRIRLQHMLDAATRGARLRRGQEPRRLARDRMIALSLIGEILIIGEAAAKVSPELKRSVASIPWGDVIGMRNRLIHGYADIDFDILWGTVKLFLAPLVAELDALLSLEDGS